jgi:hypothetical protein
MLIDPLMLEVVASVSIPELAEAALPLLAELPEAGGNPPWLPELLEAQPIRLKKASDAASHSEDRSMDFKLRYTSLSRCK